MATWWLCWFYTEVSILGSVDGRHGDLCWFYTEVSILGSVDGRHGGCVGSAQKFQF